MQKQAWGRGRGNHSNAQRIITSKQEPDLSPSQDAISPTRFVDVGDPPNIPKEEPSPKTPTRLPGIETNIVGTVESIDKRDITPDSPDVVKICREGLDSPEWPSTPA